MRESPRWRRYLRFWGPDPGRDIEDELTFHIAMKREELLATGVEASEVDAEVSRSFGDLARIQRELHEVGRSRERRTRHTQIVDEIRIDLRQAVHAFIRKPVMPLVIVATLGLSIGAATAVFTLFNAVVLNPLPVAQPSELYVLRQSTPGSNMRQGFSYPMSLFLRQNAPVSAQIAGWTTLDAGVGTGAVAEQRTVGLVTGNYFSVLGVNAQQGRLIIPDDEATPASTPYAVLSDETWRGQFGGDQDVIGRTIQVNETSFVVVGVAPARFRGTSLAEPVDVWIPVTSVGTVARSGLLANDRILDTWSFKVFRHVVRINADASVSRTVSQLSALYTRATNAANGQPNSPDQPTVTSNLSATRLTAVAASDSRAELMRFLAVLAVVVGITVGVACVNVANLLLIRARERRIEMSVRAAVGAGSGRVMRQLLLEGGVLALLSGMIGIGVMVVTVRMTATFSLPGGITLSDLPLTVSVRTLGFSVLAAVMCIIMFGLAPALAASRSDVMSTLRGGAREAAWANRLPAGNLLITVQVALSLVLLVAGSLFVRSLQEALSVDTGFRSEGVATVSVGLRQYGYSPDQAATFTRQVIEGAEARAGIQVAAAATRIPIESEAFRMPILSAAEPLVGSGSGRLSDSDAPRLPLVGITPGYFDALAMRLVSGRDVQWMDRQDAAKVAVVTQNAAHLLWPGEDPIGRQFVPMFGDPFTVVGVVRDAHLTSLGEKEPHIFVPLLQSLNLAGMDQLRFVATGSDATIALNALRDRVHRNDPRLPTFDERDVEQQINAVLMPQRFGSVLLGALAALALAICAIGIYALAAYNVVVRRRELGIRAALGAGHRELTHAVVHRSAGAVISGVVLGLVLAALATRGLRGLLFGITPYEPSAYAVAAILLGLVAVLASWLPARKAARTSPMEVIHE